MQKKIPNPIDRHVGSRVRMRRMLIGMSQEKLGESLGLTFQQVQKYEKGTNRIGASRLQQIAMVLGVPVEFFFDGAPQEAGFPDQARACRRRRARPMSRLPVDQRGCAAEPGLRPDSRRPRPAQDCRTCRQHRRGRTGHSGLDSAESVRFTGNLFV